jgi:membrane-bound metal-dependent hydrolase YbcI (DUF457 family)
LVTLAGVVPDIDGLGIVAEYLTRNSRHPLEWFSAYHHSLHSLPFAFVVAAVTFALATQRWKTASLAFLSFHIHLLEDLVGSRGPDGYQWPIPYLMPFSRACELTWRGQWMLNSWPNFAITISLLLVIFYLAWKRGFLHWRWSRLGPMPLLLPRFGSESRCRRFILEALFGALPGFARLGRARAPVPTLFYPNSFRNWPD